MTNLLYTNKGVMYEEKVDWEKTSGAPTSDIGVVGEIMASIVKYWTSFGRVGIDTIHITTDPDGNIMIQCSKTENDL